MSTAKQIAASLLGVLLILTLGLAGCGSGEPKSGEDGSNGGASAGLPAVQIEVPVKVMVYGEDARILFDETVNVEEGATALKILEATGLDLDVQRGDYGAFVNGVNGITTDGFKGWVYTINGNQVQTSADKTALKSGDKLEWSYIDMGA